MFTEGIYPIGDGLLDIDEKRLQGLLVSTDINEIYDVEQTPFARGKFAAVRRAIHKNSGVHFAAKFLKRRRRAQSSDKEIKHEIAVLMLCQDEENIVKLNAVHETRSDTALLLELATGGELQTFLDNEDCLSEAHARICMREVLKALQFLHKRSIAHLDLKPQNILLTGERIEDGLKLCDFGISRVVAEGTNVREIVGTPDYVAPEVLQYEPLSLLTDIWSVGVLAYVLLSGFSPFGGETKQETFLNISQCALTFPDKLFDGVSAAAIDFIRQALRIKPSERMTAAGCLEHYWLKDECSIERQLFNGIANKQANVNVDELDVDATDEEEEEEEEEEVVVDVDQEHEDQDEAQDISIDDDEEEDHEHEQHQNSKVELSITTSTNNLDNNPIIGCKMDSSDTDIDLFTTTETSPDTSTVHLSNGTASPQCTKTVSSPSPSPLAATVASRARSGTRPAIAAKPTTTTTTAILTLPPAARATTIPLYNVQQSHLPPTHQQQQHYITARRQSSESNKENTFLATKKIAANSHAIKKPIQAITAQTPSSNAGTNSTITTTTIATIMIGSPEVEDSTMHNGSFESSGNIVTTTITLPNGDRNKQQQQQQQCLFPDAPTTPKVIRKAPTTDTSPTSVKALVKKFQLETGKQLSEKHLKEAQLNQQHMHAADPSTVRRSSTNTMPPQTAITAAAPLVNGKHSATGEQKSTTSNNTTTTANKQTKFVHSNSVKETTTTTVSHNGTTATRSTRRASEPITGVHKKSTAVIALQPRHSVSSSTGGNYKSTCVFGIGCNGRSSNGVITSLAHNECRHSSNSNNNNSNSSKVTSPSTAAAKATASASSSSSSSSTAAAALLLSSHHHHHQLHQQHHHHHHHHHHGVAKSATNNLSMDQGIIC